MKALLELVLKVSKIKVGSKGTMAGVLLLTVAICSATLIGQESSKGLWEFLYFDESPMLTFEKSVDGHNWREFSEVQRYGYVSGYLTGFHEGFVNAWLIATESMTFPYDPRIPLSFEEVVEGVNDFYSDYANRKIRLGMTLPIIIGRICGYISDIQATERIQAYRRASASSRESLGD